MGSITKVLSKAKFRGTMNGFLYLTTYRETNRMILSDDDVIVLLAHHLFNGDKMPDKINVTVSWDSDKVGD